MSDQPTLGQAARALAERCNFASTWDGAGFSKFDADFGHSLAERPDEQWSAKQKFAGHKMLRKYRVQLAGLGIDFDAIPVPADPSLVLTPPPPAVRAFFADQTVAPQPQTNICRLAPGTKTLEIATPYNPRLITEVKNFAGRRWDQGRRVWTVPVDDENIIALDGFLTTFGIRRSEEVAALFTERVAALKAKSDQESALEAASRAHTGDLTIPGLAGTLRPFQRAGISYALLTKRTFICDEMGLGKTVEAIGTLEAANAYPALIIPPATLKPNWRREIQAWLPHRSVAVLGRSPDLFALRADIVIVNYDSLGKFKTFLMDRPWKAVVCDESHYTKTPGAQRTVHVQEIVDHAKPEFRLMLTGTPVMNRPAELISQLAILGRLEEDFGGQREFKNRYVYGMRLKELNDRLRRTCLVRRLKSEVLTELPPKNSAMQSFEITNRTEYDNAERDVIAWVEARASADESYLGSLTDMDDEERKEAIKLHASDAGRRAERAEALVRIGALKYLAAKGKLKAATDWVRDFLESGQKLVVFAERIEFQRALYAAFPGAARVFAEDSVEVRQTEVDRFQGDERCRLIVCSLAAGGVGITLTAASDVAMFEVGWTPGGVDQAVDRCHRIGQRDSVTAWYLNAESTIDQWVAEMIDTKRKVVTAATDGAEVEQGNLLLELMNRLVASKRRS